MRMVREVREVRPAKGNSEDGANAQPAAQPKAKGTKTKEDVAVISDDDKTLVDS